MSLVGYARVSTGGQELHLQTDALESLGCDRIFTETASGAKADRPELAACLAALTPGDTLIVWKFDRIGRGVVHLAAVLKDLQARGVHFRSVTEGVDTATPAGKMVFHVIAAMAEFERDLTVERTNDGLRAARRRGRRGGQPKKLTGVKLDQAREMKASGRHTMADIAEALSVSQATLYRWLRPDDEMEATG